MLLYLFSALCFLAAIVLGNVEKVIFMAPEATKLPSDASIDNLLLVSLNPKHPSVRTYLNASFPANASPRGTETWLLLEGLTPNQRYEVRICWLATQPTAFWLYSRSISDTFETPEYISSLSSYAYVRHADLSDRQTQALQARRLQASRDLAETSFLFLQIYAAADYYSVNKTLMEHVPPVLVDIILDPFILNVFPQSLRPTAVYITFIAIAAWFLSARIMKQLYIWSLDNPRPSATVSKIDSGKKSR